MTDPNDDDGAWFLERDVLDAPPVLEYRPVPGFPRHRVGSDRSVWYDHRRPGLPPPWNGPLWRPLKPARISGRPGFVRLRHGGREHVRSVALLVRAAFSPDPALWLDRIGPRPQQVRAATAPPSAPGSGPDGLPPATPASIPAAGIPAEVPSPSVLYRPIPGFPGYRLGIDGSVWSCLSQGGRGGVSWPPAWRRLEPVRAKGKGPRICLYRDGRAYAHTIGTLHTRVFPPEEFAPDLPAGAPTHGLPGSLHGRAVLDEEKVAEARRLRSEGWGLGELCDRYGVGRVTLHYALVGKTWAHVPMVAGPPGPCPLPPCPAEEGETDGDSTRTA